LSGLLLVTTKITSDCDFGELIFQQGYARANIVTTKLYDRRGDNPEKSASFFANY
jgi:hypothetical protein